MDLHPPLAIAGLSEPTESRFEIIKDLNPHAPIDCDRFPKFSRIKHWFLKDVSELRFPGNTMFSYASRNCVSCELTVNKTLDDARFARYLASINEDTSDFVELYCINNLKKRPFSFLYRKFTRDNYPEQSWFTADSQHQTHFL